MRVMKFGGASVKNAEAIKNVTEIISKHKDQPCLIVISAMDKTTNELELLAHLAKTGKEEEAIKQFKKIRRFHIRIAHDLVEKEHIHTIQEKIRPFLEEVERIVKGISITGRISSANL